MRLKSLLLAAAIAVAAPLSAIAQTTPIGSAFTYQGELAQTGTPAAGNFDFRFTLYGTATGGSPIGPAVERLATTVGGGRFTAELDFGPTAFDSGARWLEIAVRVAGASTYEVLTPRQRVTPSPIALRAESAATADAALVAAAAPWAGLTGIPQGFVDNVDNDLLAALNCQPGQTVVRSAGDVWICVPRTTGTVTSILFSFPFEVAQSDNPVTASGIVGLREDSIGSQFITDGSITAADINATQVQRRITGTCGVGQVITAIAQDGGVSCAAVPQPTRTTAYPSSIFGEITDLALNPSGIPFGVGSIGGAAGGPRLYRCQNAGCTTLPVSTPLPIGGDLSQGFVVWATTWGASGPVALSYRADNRRFVLTQCTTADCSAPVARSIGPAAASGAAASGEAIYMPADNRAVAVFGIDNALHLAKCDNAACDTVTTQDLGFPEQVLSPVIVAPPGQSELIISGGNGRLQVGVCAPGSNCATGLYVNEVPVTGAVRIRNVSANVPADGRPVIAFNDDNGNLFIGRCGPAGSLCIDATFQQPLGPGPATVGAALSLLPPDNGPPAFVLSAQQSNSGGPFVTTVLYRCADADCTTIGSAVQLPGSPGGSTGGVPAVRAADATPLFAMIGSFIKCGSASCE